MEMLIHGRAVWQHRSSNAYDHHEQAMLMSRSLSAAVSHSIDVVLIVSVVSVLDFVLAEHFVQLLPKQQCYHDNKKHFTSLSIFEHIAQGMRLVANVLEHT